MLINAYVNHYETVKQLLRCIDEYSVPLAFNVIFRRLLCDIVSVELQFTSQLLFSLKND